MKYVIHGVNNEVHGMESSEIGLNYHNNPIGDRLNELVDLRVNPTKI